MKKVIAKLQLKIAKLKKEYDSCRGYGMAESNFERMREINGEIKGLRYAVRIARAGK